MVLQNSMMKTPTTATSAADRKHAAALSASSSSSSARRTRSATTSTTTASNPLASDKSTRRKSSLAPSSEMKFVFKAEEDDDDDEDDDDSSVSSETSSSEDDDDDEMLKSAKKRKTNKKVDTSRGSNRGGSATKRKKSSPSAAKPPLNASQTSLGSNASSRKTSSFSTLHTTMMKTGKMAVANWRKRYDASPMDASREVLYALCAASGVPAVAIEDSKLRACNVRREGEVETFLTSLTDLGGASPLFSKASVSASTSAYNSFASFWQNLWALAASVSPSGVDDGAAGAALALAMCVSRTRASKTLRLVGTVAAMESAIGMMQRRAAAAEDLARLKQLLTTEVARCLEEEGEGGKARSATVREKTAALIAALDRAMGMETAASSSNSSFTQSSQAPGGLSSSSASAATQSNHSNVDALIEALQEAASEWREAGSGGLLSDAARQLAIDATRVAVSVRRSTGSALDDKDSVFLAVASRRFRDAEPQVRARVARLLGDLASAAPELLTAPHKSKYLGWMLFDTSPLVRHAAMEALLGLLEAAPDVCSRKMRSFFERFSPRLAGALRDVEPPNVPLALRLAAAAFKLGLLTREDDAELVTEGEERVFTPGQGETECEIRAAAAEFCCAVNPSLIVRGEGSTASSRPEKKKHNNKKATKKKKNDDEDDDDDDEAQLTTEQVVLLYRRKVRALLELCVRHKTNSPGDCARLADAFSARLRDQDAKAMIEVLSGDDKQLTEFETCALVRVLSSHVKLAIPLETEGTTPAPSAKPSRKNPSRGGKKGTSRSEEQENEDVMASMVARALPALLTKYRGDDDALASLLAMLSAIPEASIDNELTDGQIDKLLRELASCVLTKTNAEVLEGACAAMATLASRSSTGERARRTMMDTADKVGDETLGASEGFGSLSFSPQAARAWAARASAVARCTSASSAATGGDEGAEKLESFVKAVLDAGFSTSSSSEETEEDEVTAATVSDILRALLARAAWEVTDALVATAKRQESESNEDGEGNELAALGRCVKSRDALTSLLTQVFSRTDARARRLQSSSLGLVMDCATIFWPGSGEFGWRMSSALSSAVAEATWREIDAALVQDADTSMEVEDPLAHRALLEAKTARLLTGLVLPAARVVLYATPRMELSLGASLLSFINDGEASEVAQVAHHINSEMKQNDPGRLLQMHLETLMRFPRKDVAEALVKSLGSARSKFAEEKLNGPVSRMLRRAIAEVASKQVNVKILGLVVSYIDFIRSGDAKARLLQLWQEVMGKGDVEETEEGAAFEAKLKGERLPSPEDKRKKLRRGAKETSARPGGKRKRGEVDDEEEESSSSSSSSGEEDKVKPIPLVLSDAKRRGDEENANNNNNNNRRSARLRGKPVTKPASPMEEKEEEESEIEEEEEEEDLERNVFEEEAEKKKTKSPTTRKEVVTSAVSSEAPATASQKRQSVTNNKNSPVRITQRDADEESEDAISSADDDDDDMIGFKPKVWR